MERKHRAQMGQLTPFWGHPIESLQCVFLGVPDSERLFVACEARENPLGMWNARPKNDQQFRRGSQFFTIRSHCLFT